MAEIIWGLATSHVPSIGAAIDDGKTQDPYWKPLFDGYRPAQDWMARHVPDVALIIYNDHANAFGLDIVPTFAIGTAERYQVADEGFGRRPVPDVEGAPELSNYLLEKLVDDGFDLTVCESLDVDHGLTVSLSVFYPDPGDRWPCAVVPILVNVIRYPQPTAARCYALGRAIKRAIDTFPGAEKIAVFGTGGMSHQLAGTRAGLINTAFDQKFLDAIEKSPLTLTGISRDEYIRQAGSEGIELVMWLIMRGALNENVRRVHSVYHVPVSNTAAALALFDNRDGI